MDMSGMDMGNATASNACKMNMLWNWYTIDACFITENWHIRTTGQYAGTVIGIFLMVVAVEGVRRLAREYDRKIIRDHSAASSSRSSLIKGETVFVEKKPFRPSVQQQAIRSFFYFVQFSVGYLLMLTAMYYNGGLLLAIFFGSFFGFFLTSWDTVGHVEVAKDCCS